MYSLDNDSYILDLRLNRSVVCWTTYCVKKRGFIYICRKQRSAAGWILWKVPSEWWGSYTTGQWHGQGSPSVPVPRADSPRSAVMGGSVDVCWIKVNIWALRPVHSGSKLHHKQASLIFICLPVEGEEWVGWGAICLNLLLLAEPETQRMLCDSFVGCQESRDWLFHPLPSLTF